MPATPRNGNTIEAIREILPRGRFMPSASSAAGMISTWRMTAAKNLASGTRSTVRTLSIVSCGSNR
jgi:hypothetical protein